MTSPPETVVTVGWIAPMALELAPALAVLEQPTTKAVPGDDTLYRVGRIGGHWVLMAVCPRIGTHPANTVLANMRRSFPNIKHVLVVGIAGGMPYYGPSLQEQIVLGDVVVSCPQGSEGGVAHYEFGAWEVEYRLTVSGHTLHPTSALLTALKRRNARGIKATREKDSPCIHYGTIGSANTVVMSSAKRNDLYRKYQIIRLEMESAGVISEYQGLVIRGICDYADSHKSKKWQKYAAATAAAYAKEVLLLVPPAKLDERDRANSFCHSSSTAVVLRRAPHALQDLVENFHRRRKEIGEFGKKWQWHQQELRRFFESSLLKVLEARSVWLLVDTLDECGKENAVDLFQWLQSLLRMLPPTGSQCRICLTCRHYPILSSYCGFEICPELENGQDISTYVRVKLSESHDLTASPIPAFITNGASGVFMWARFVVNQVLDLEREGAELKEIEAAVHSTPPDLDELYRGLVQHMGPASIKLVHWICFATRPLTLDELIWAMVVEVDCQHQSLKACQSLRNYISDKNKMKRKVQTLSCGLAEVTPSPKKQVVQFIHQSVKDFFVEKGLFILDSSLKSIDVAIGMAHHRLSMICIRYLAMEEISQSTSYEHADFPFLAYVTTSWDDHGRTPLSWAAEKGHAAIIKSLLDTGKVDVGSKDSKYGRTPLSWAVQNAHAAVVKLLFDTGKVDVDSTDSVYGRTPLSWAAENRHEAVVKLLFDTGKVDVDSKESVYGRTPLSWAAEKGHEAIVKLLLNTGKVDVNSKDSKYGRTPLSWAVKKGHAVIVELLLNTGKVDVGSKDKYGHTPLSWAAEKGHEAVVKLLLDTGKAGVDSKDICGQTPLSWAVASGHEAVVNLLLDTGKVDVNSKENEFGQTPLSWAARNGHEVIVKLLLNTGKVDVNSKDKYGRTVLSRAAENGHEAVVKLLFYTGKVDVDSKDSCGQTPLSLAVANGHEAVVKLLESAK
ncbi:hypothetical protein DL771_009138 [Monosporascus sp. 5C6A]|nr:hypothetical protein DL771_009138 [Monosporascus sp. 5C6A]